MNGWFKESYRHSLAARGITTSYYAKKQPVLKEWQLRRLESEVLRDRKKIRKQRKEMKLVPLRESYLEKEQKRKEEARMRGKPRLDVEDAEDRAYKEGTLIFERTESEAPMPEKVKKRKLKKQQEKDLALEASILESETHEINELLGEDLKTANRTRRGYRSDKSSLDKDEERFMTQAERDVRAQQSLTEEQSKMITDLKELQGKRLKFEGDNRDQVMRGERAFVKSARKNVKKVGNDWLIDEMRSLEKTKELEPVDVQRLQEMKFKLLRENKEAFKKHKYGSPTDEYVRDTYGTPLRKRRLEVRKKAFKEGLRHPSAVEDIRVQRRNLSIEEKEFKHSKKGKKMLEKERMKRDEEYDEAIGKVLRAAKKQEKRERRMQEARKLVSTPYGKQYRIVQRYDVEGVPEGWLKRKRRKRA